MWGQVHQAGPAVSCTKNVSDPRSLSDDQSSTGCCRTVPPTRKSGHTASMTSSPFRRRPHRHDGKKERIFSPLPRHASLEDLVPEDNFYRRLETRLDLSFVREVVRPFYAKGGRPSVDPVVFFKLQLVLFFEGLSSERELMVVAADRLSVRWYLGYDLHESLPDHSNLTRTRERFGLSVFRRFFEEIVEMCAEPAGPALLRRALRRPGQGLPRYLHVREGAAQEAGVGGTFVRGGQGPARYEEVQAQEIWVRHPTSYVSLGRNTSQLVLRG
jgi:transposase